MKVNRFITVALAGVAFIAARLLADSAAPTNTVAASTPPVFVPDTTHSGEDLPDGVILWDDLMKTTNAAADQESADFTINFTNAATTVSTTTITNITSTTTNITVITNSITPSSITLLDVHPSCSCTVAQLPPIPWTIPPGSNGQINVSVNLEGKSGTLFKYLDISTDRGTKKIWLRITILPPVIPVLSDDDRAMGVAAAKVDRQAVFKNDCATCHSKPGQGKYAKALYDSVCAVCHEAEHRATMVPDLHNLKVPTDYQFWQTWIAHGKAGSLMPAFSTADGGPLNDMQIAGLAAYLDTTIPSHVPPATNAPAAK